MEDRRPDPATSATVRSKLPLERLHTQGTGGHHRPGLGLVLLMSAIWLAFAATEAPLRAIG